MRDTSARMLALLGLLQSRVDWSGAELARAAGRHRPHRAQGRDPAAGASATPSTPSAAPAAATAWASAPSFRRCCSTTTRPSPSPSASAPPPGWPGFEETGARALAKLEQVLPEKLRRRLTALRAATSAGPVNTDSNVEDPVVDAEVLNELAAAIRDHQGLRCYYRDQPCEIEPYHLVGWQRRWYLVGRDPSTGVWAPYRVDWLRLRTPGGRRFTPLPFPGDLTEFVVREVARTGWAVHARIHVHAPAEVVMARINPAVGTVEAVTDTESVLVTGGDSLEVVAVWIGMLGLDFSVTSPPALVDHLRVLVASLRAGDRRRTLGATGAHITRRGPALSRSALQTPFDGDESQAYRRPSAQIRADGCTKTEAALTVTVRAASTFVAGGTFRCANHPFGHGRFHAPNTGCPGICLPR